MNDKKVKSGKQGKQIDNDLRFILSILELAPSNNGKVLYIKQGEVAFGDGESLFDITPLT